MTPFVLSSAAQLNKADPAFDPSTFASNLLLERPHEQLVVLGREQLEHLVVYTIDVTAQALLLVFLGGTAHGWLSRCPPLSSKLYPPVY